MCKQCIRSIRSWMNKQGRTHWDQIILLSHPGWFWWAWVGWTWLPFGPWLSSDLQGTLHSVFKSFWMNCSQESECLNLTPLMSFLLQMRFRCSLAAGTARYASTGKAGSESWRKGFSYSSSVLSLQYILFAACVRVGWTCCFLWNWNKFLNARIPKLGDLVNHGKQSWIRVGGSGSKRFQGLFRRRHTQLELPSCWNYWRPTEAWWSHWWRGSSGLWKSHRLPIFPKQSRRFIKG